MGGLLALSCTVLAFVIGSLVISPSESLALRCSVALVIGFLVIGSSLALWIALSSLDWITLSSLDWIFTSLCQMLSKVPERMLIKLPERMLIRLLERMLIKLVQWIWMLIIGGGEQGRGMLVKSVGRIWMLVKSIGWMLIIGGGAQGRGNGYDDDNDGGCIIGSVEKGRRQQEGMVNNFLQVIQTIAFIMCLNEGELSTTRRVIQLFSMIIKLMGNICFVAVLWLPYTNPRVARILNPRISGILRGIGFALAFLGFVLGVGTSIMACLDGGGMEGEWRGVE